MSNLPVEYTPEFLRGWEADVLFGALHTSLPWEQKEIKMYGKTVLIPRLTCWIGDAAYSYSGISNAANHWTPILDKLRDLVEAETGATFNSCLANLYRDGRDTVGWHSDDEPELGESPTIASISLGSPRTFKLRHEATREVTDFELGHGSLIVMRDESQSGYRHSVPRRARVTDARINLTFRQYN